jgi:hypothetical protein
MQFPRLTVPILLTATGLFLLSQGIDSLKVEHLGIRLLTVQWLGVALRLTYHSAGIVCIVVGFPLMFLGSEICRRADKRVVAAIPGISSPRSFRFVIPAAGLLAFIGWAIVSTWFTTRSI